MQAFAALLEDLSYAPRRNDKLALMEVYFRTAPDPDRGWALSALTGGLPLRLPLRRILLDVMTEKIDPVLYRMSRDYVGDTAETVALLWPAATETGTPLRLGEVVALVMEASKAELPAVIGRLLDGMTIRERWAFLKLLGGAPRVGVSAKLAKTALAAAIGRDLAEVEEIWHGLKPPYIPLFAWGVGSAPRPAVNATALFRPIMLAVPLEDDDVATFAVNDFAAEWKWDGIRVQIAAGDGAARIYSRTGDDIGAAFPDVADAFAGQSLVADGELLVARAGVIAPFAELQQRLNRKSVGAEMIRRYPAFVRLYDLLLLGNDDLRALPFVERRKRLEAWHGHGPPRGTDLSELIAFERLSDLSRLRDGARAAGIEGIMLKRKNSPYIGGRPKGHWFKWKRNALTLDCVLMYAQRGSGKRSSYYSDYTFGVWRDGGERRELVPIGKAYSGFTDDELRELDRFVRQNTIEQFGPVRSVKGSLVFEVAFDAIQPSKRHKSGLAMRFPRIKRIRWDKPADEADTLAAAQALRGN